MTKIEVKCESIHSSNRLDRMVRLNLKRTSFKNRENVIERGTGRSKRDRKISDICGDVTSGCTGITIHIIIERDTIEHRLGRSIVRDLHLNGIFHAIHFRNN